MIFHENAFKSQPQAQQQTTNTGGESSLTKRFIPPNPTDIPSDLFIADDTHGLRYVHKKDPTQILIYTAGASLHEGMKEKEAAAGFAFVICPPSLIAINDPGIVVSARLEQHGPPRDDDGTARPHEQTAVCATIRAVVAALQYRKWPDVNEPGYNKVIIATHDEGFVDSIVDRVDGWWANGWKTKQSKMIKNSDMWEMLASGLKIYAERGLTVEFWKITKAENALALEEAKKVCSVKEASVYMSRLV